LVSSKIISGRGGRIMSFWRKGYRDGSGPYRGSYRRRVEGKKIGRRRASGIRCPKRKGGGM